jgi:hypothetical protein
MPPLVLACVQGRLDISGLPIKAVSLRRVLRFRRSFSCVGLQTVHWVHLLMHAHAQHEGLGGLGGLGDDFLRPQIWRRNGWTSSIAPNINKICLLQVWMRCAGWYFCIGPFAKVELLGDRRLLQVSCVLQLAWQQQMRAYYQLCWRSTATLL